MTRFDIKHSSEYNLESSGIKSVMGKVKATLIAQVLANEDEMNEEEVMCKRLLVSSLQSLLKVIVSYVGSCLESCTYQLLNQMRIK